MTYILNVTKENHFQLIFDCLSVIGELNNNLIQFFNKQGITENQQNVNIFDQINDYELPEDFEHLDDHYPDYCNIWDLFQHEYKINIVCMKLEISVDSDIFNRYNEYFNS